MACCMATAAGPVRAAVTVDGNAAVADAYTTLHTQIRESGYGNGNVLASVRYVQTGNTLNLIITGRATNNAILLFIDAKGGGVSRITPNLISTQPGGEQDFINLLALSDTEGMTFENGFVPETAIRIFGDDVAAVKHAYVNHFDLVAGTQVYGGDAHAGVVSEGPVRQMKAIWEDVGDGNGTNGYNTHTKGVEIALNLSALGVSGGSQTVKIMAIMVSPAYYDEFGNVTSFEGSNQTLGSLGTISYGGMGSGVNTFNFQTEPQTQTLSIPVTGLDPAGDEDLDGLLNGVETGTGVFVDATHTGTNPEVADTDGDSYQDGPEVNGTALGYVSDPNIKNYTNMAITGSFNRPTPWQPVGSSNTPSTAMVQESQSLTGQYRWVLDYPFASSQVGAFSYKITSGGSFLIQWGSGSVAGTAQANGNDITGSVALTGAHRFTFDQKTLAYTFSRAVYPNVTAYLNAYGLTAGVDSDGDGIWNENEFAANSDPLTADTDGDGYDDPHDGLPLVVIAPGGGYAAWAAGLIPGNQSQTADYDSDGLSNYIEFLFGSSPTFPARAPTPTELIGGNMLIHWLQRTSGATYQLYESSSLSPQNQWSISSASVASDPNQANLPAGYVRKTATIPTSQSQHKFFRVSVHD